MRVELSFLLIGGVILLGFAARLLFERTRIPDVLVLMGFGVFLGYSISPAARGLIYQFAPYVGTLALIMILFEGGLHIDPGQALAQVRPALLLSSLSLLVSGLLITAALHLAWGWALLPSVLLGTALGCTSSAIVIPVAKHTAISEETRTLIDLDAAFSDTFAIVALLVFMDLAQAGGNVIGSGLAHLLGSFGIAAAIALVISVAWLLVLEYTKRRPLSYLLTFAVIVLLYALVEFLKGSGAIAVLLFGILVTESKRLPRWVVVFGKPSPALGREEAHTTMQWFHQELTFLVRTFFFVYLGLLFEAERLTPVIVWSSVALTGLIALGRGGSVYLLRRSFAGQSLGLLTAFLPRGLVSAVLAGLPAAHGLAGTERFLDYTVPVIILTNLLMAGGLFVMRPKSAAAVR